MKEKIIYFLLAFAAWVLVGTSFWLGLFSGLESFFQDLLFSPRPISPKIIIVAIDSESINKIGQWPWPREIFATALKELEKHQLAAVGFDIMLSEASRLGAADDKALADSLERISFPLVMPIEAVPLIFDKNNVPRAGAQLRPLDGFQKSERVSLGHVNLILDRDGMVRKFAPKVVFDETTGESSIPSFAYEVLTSAKEKIPTEDNLGVIEQIAFSAPTGSIRKVSFVRLFEKKTTLDLKDKIILIGVTASDLHDEKLTPMSHGTEMAGVEIQGNIANMLIQGYRLKPLDNSFMLLWLVFASFLPAFTFLVFRQSLKPILVSLVVGIGHFAAAVALFEYGTTTNMLHINFAWIFSTLSISGYRYFSIEREKIKIRNLFSKYVSRDVLEEILRSPDSVSLGGEEKEITVFFSDIRGFTTISEKTTPQQLVQVLNRYFTVMSNEVLKHKGVLDKYIGDAIMAFWGAPIADPNQADNALRAALGMVGELHELNKEFQEKWGVEINIGIGIFTGPAVVGNIGSKERFDYTIIGDTVNVASRLEGLNKEYKTRIIIGESTKKVIRGNYNFRYLGKVFVKGREEPIGIYTI